MLPPIDRVTVAPASALPLIAADCSPALTMSSPATVRSWGAFGARVSTVMVRVPAEDVLPAASVAFTDSVSAPWPMAVMSSGCSV